MFQNQKTCFEEHLQTAASIRCYFDTTNQKQSGFCTTYSFKILALSEIMKISKKCIIQFSYNITTRTNYDSTVTCKVTLDKSIVPTEDGVQKTKFS